MEKAATARFSRCNALGSHGSRQLSVFPPKIRMQFSELQFNGAAATPAYLQADSRLFPLPQWGCHESDIVAKRIDHVGGACLELQYEPGSDGATYRDFPGHGSDVSSWNSRRANQCHVSGWAGRYSARRKRAFAGRSQPCAIRPDGEYQLVFQRVGNSSSSTFDGAGVSTNPTASCSVGASTGTASGTLSTSSLDGVTGSTVSAGTIPLGATELDSGGLSPLVAPPTFGSSCVVGSPTTMTAAVLGSTIAGGTTSLTGSAPIGLSSGC